jgi:hypothetical protein
MAQARFAEILGRLAAGEVDFVVVGMTAGILHGVPITTLDLDIVHGRAPANVARLLRVLDALDATYRHDARRLRPQESHLAGTGHQLLTTSLGDLDCLGTIAGDRGYEDLLPDTVPLELADGAQIRVLSLPALIAAQERTARPKDLAVLPVLRATLDERNRQAPET